MSRKDLRSGKTGNSASFQYKEKTRCELLRDFHLFEQSFLFCLILRLVLKLTTFFVLYSKVLLDTRKGGSRTWVGTTGWYSELSFDEVEYSHAHTIFNRWCHSFWRMGRKFVKKGGIFIAGSPLYGKTKPDITTWHVIRGALTFLFLRQTNAQEPIVSTTALYRRQRTYSTTKAVG